MKEGKIVKMWPNGSPEVQSINQEEYDLFLARYKEFLENKTITLLEFNQRVRHLDNLLEKNKE
jgi:hypothetical protein